MVRLKLLVIACLMSGSKGVSGDCRIKCRSRGGWIGDDEERVDRVHF